MKIGIIFLTVAYVLSQFFRSFLAVLTDVLETDVGATPDELAFSLGLWFLTFSVMQLPVGWSLDRLGPKLVSSLLLILGGAGGAVLFATAQNPEQIIFAMALLGVGCSPILMASYFIFAKLYEPKVFATLAAIVAGVGSLGNLLGSAPLNYAVSSVGWRASLWGLALLTFLVAIALFFTVKNPPNEPNANESRVGFLYILRLREIWFLAPMVLVCYAPVSGIRGLWLGPFFRDKFDASPEQIGNIGMLMSIAMIIGIFVYGPMDRLFGTRKWIVFFGNLICAISIFALWKWTSMSFATTVIFFTIIGFFGMSFPLIVAHGRSFVPKNLAGRGVTLMNLFAISGAGISQVLTGYLYENALLQTNNFQQAYASIFAMYFGFLIIGLGVYFFSSDNLS